MGRDGKTLNIIIYVYQTIENELTIALHGLHFNDLACTVCCPMVYSDKDAASTSAHLLQGVEELSRGLS